MSGHTMFHVFLDVLFIANIALFFYLLHKKTILLAGYLDQNGLGQLIE